MIEIKEAPEFVEGSPQNVEGHFASGTSKISVAKMIEAVKDTEYYPGANVEPVNQAPEVLTNPQNNANVKNTSKDISSLQEERNNLSERSSNELRELQAEGIRNLAERGFSDKGPEIDDLLRGRISDILGREMGRRYGSHGNDSRILNFGEGESQYNMYENVD